MKRAALILAALAAILTAAAAPVRTATENFVTNKIAEAVAAIPSPDYSTNNAALVETAHFAISSFVATGTVKKAKSANTATRADMAETATFAYNLYSLPDWTSWTVASLLNAATNAANHAVDVFSDNLAAVATSGKYSDLSGKPTNVSDFSNDAGYLTGYTETDPTVPQWAKAPTKPTYTASEVGATDGGVVTNIVRGMSLGGIWDQQLGVWWTPHMANGALRYETNAVQNAADTLAVVSNVVASGGLASVDAVDAKISTNNAAFVEAVTNCPVVIASGGGGGGGFPAGDWSDYGTLGALLAAIIAAITWLKNNQRYALHTVTLTNGAGTLIDRAGNLVVVSGDTTLTLPSAVPGYCRDFLVRLEISGSTVPTITFAAPTGETITYETDGDEFPVPDEAGTWSYSFTENCVAHKFAVSLKKVNEVAQGGA